MASIIVSAVFGAINPVESFWVDLGMAVGYALFVLWLGDGIFLRGVFQDAVDAERTSRVFRAIPHLRTNLLLIGLFFGAISTGATWMLAHYAESIWIFIVPVLVFGCVLWALVAKFKGLANQLAEQDGPGQPPTRPEFE